jgi:tetratricopeptide (TPR) repeat protein
LRFTHSRSLRDLDEAVEVAQAAVEATPAGHPRLTQRQANLGNALRARAEERESLPDLNAAVETARAAAHGIPADHPDRAALLSNLGINLRVRGEWTKKLPDLNAAVRAALSALEVTPADDLMYARRLAGLGASLQTRFEQTRSPHDLDRAVNALSAAVAACAYESDRVIYLSNLGRALRFRFDMTGDAAARDGASAAWREAARITSAPAWIRVQTARGWGHLGADGRLKNEAEAGFALAVELLPLLAWHGVDRRSREQQLERETGLAGNAAAWAINGGHHGRACELLDQGRSVLWSQQLNLRGDLDELHRSQPELAHRMRTIRVELDQLAGEELLPIRSATISRL